MVGRMNRPELTPEQIASRSLAGAKSICQFCKHLEEWGGEDGWTCPAYPEGIPGDILLLDRPGESPHTSQRYGQVGDYIYEPIIQTIGKIKFTVGPDWKIDLIT